jgi:trk system potassium uptake protein
MKLQIMVIGLGQFGMSLTRALSARGVEVLAIDRDEARVRTASEHAAEALCFDATDEPALARTAPGRRDVCVCAIGDEATEASIICTALLKQMGAQRLVARTNNALHERILRLVGADAVIDPEREFGERFANQLMHEGLMGELPLGGDLVITEMRVPGAFVGRTLIDLALPRRFNVTVVAVRRPDEPAVLLPDPKQPFSDADILVVVAQPDAVSQMLDRLG